MGFMDRAKKLAEEAQRKMDETQKRFNDRKDDESQPGAGTVRFDENGRPIPDETAEAQAAAGIPVGESMQVEPGTVPSGQAQPEPGRAHEPVEGEAPEGFEHPGEGQPPAGRVERSGSAGNAEENRGTSPVESDDIHASPETKK